MPDPRLVQLAEGETLTLKQEILVKTSVPFQDYQYQTITIDIVVAGENDAPKLLANRASLMAVEDGGAATLDLATLADDVDSDDDGSTLRYEIVSAPAGLNVAIVGSLLTLDPSSVPQALSSDEAILGDLVVRAVDRHGAVTENLTVKLTVQGVDDERQIYVTAEGVDYAGLGVSPEAAVNYGVLTQYNVTPEIAADILNYSDGNDVEVIGATRLALFDRYSELRDSDGNVIRESAAFDTGGGDDVLVFDIGSDEFAGFEMNDVLTGDGEDVVVVNATSANGPAVINGAEIETGSKRPSLARNQLPRQHMDQRRSRYGVRTRYRRGSCKQHDRGR